ncbi:MAG: RIP metalloprotease RseP, partial [Deltaproteobacteria bacterium]|nr:RIP metalloprotease RseP [Deltaproteobacteria bacterium]
MMAILYFILGLGLLIFIHELGHFLVAKANGIRVERFSLGFGPRIIKFTVGETEYCISLLPLGGYVKMTGQEDFGEEELPALDDPKAFNSKGLLARISVVLAGPAMNLILPFILMPMVFWVGREEPLYLDQEAKISGLLENMPAAEAGLQAGDKILSINGEQVKTWEEALKKGIVPIGDRLEVQLMNQAGEEETLTLQAQAFKDQQDRGYFGWEPIFFWDQEPIVAEVSQDSPAQKAGLQKGDKLLAIGGEPLQYWRDLPDKLEKTEGKLTELKIKRGEESLTLQVSPRYDEELK